ncbi:hypothetical protein LJC42_00340 [Eubacteriales bacterium OttesenSCG-928-K08]|nr:hypothetical protein [Eubacteriales bacterium OttesenSCG-928-K08]
MTRKNPFLQAKSDDLKGGEPRKTTNTLATVISADTEGTILRFDGETVSREKPYMRLSSYVPSAGDRVLLLGASGTSVILGKVVK